MPTYEYLCKDCGKEFEKIQRMSDPKIKQCPYCNQEHVERLISRSSFTLKGSGWYKDGYGNTGSTSFKNSTEQEKNIDDSSKKNSSEDIKK